ncbi:MAG TPA: SCO1664 family protein [Propionibacteriaceae bacterium]|nr:SCO1664 family protein [Propionibacteriaceae bacterium]
MSASFSADAHPALTTRLGNGELELTGRLMQASNATFLASWKGTGTVVDCVYKPIRGERPLWDFPTSTLALREVAAYEVSRIGGFDVVPVTVLVEGPIGPGSLQVWVDTEPEENELLVDLVPYDQVPEKGWFVCAEGLDAYDHEVCVIHADNPELRLLAVFDVLINNADRKGGHILGSAGRVFGVDHGISFHAEPKLRTLLWGWAGQELTERELTAVATARREAPAQLAELLAEEEIEAFDRRADLLLRRRKLPTPRGGRTIPWPPF